MGMQVALISCARHIWFMSVLASTVHPLTTMVMSRCHGGVSVEAVADADDASSGESASLRCHLAGNHCSKIKQRMLASGGLILQSHADEIWLQQSVSAFARVVCNAVASRRARGRKTHPTPRVGLISPPSPLALIYNFCSGVSMDSLRGARPWPTIAVATRIRHFGCSEC